MNGSFLKNIKIDAKPEGISHDELFKILDDALSMFPKTYKKVLLLPPDLTRKHSQAGVITAYLWRRLREMGCTATVLPALGSHVPMTKDECEDMFGSIPYTDILHHNWRTDVVSVGEVPADVMRELSEGEMTAPVNVELNRALLDKSYDAILSIGQVVPHEVVGMANYTKNIVVGCGGISTINASHILGATYGLERLMGKDHSPVRKMFDYIQEKLLSELPLEYILTANADGKIKGIYIGADRKCFEDAVTRSTSENITFMEKPCEKVVVMLDPDEYRSTWIGNKAIYRTRMAIADGGELIILAPGVERFGEDKEIDLLIRKYGYTGRGNILEKMRSEKDLEENLSAAAHLIHGSSDGRFKITYCTEKLTREEIEGAGFSYMSYAEARAKYDPDKLVNGQNATIDGEIFYIPNPAVGLWTCAEKFYE